MIEQLLFILVLSLGDSAIMFYAIKQILVEEVKDELNLPLVNCDTSMFDEIKNEKEEVP